MKRSTGAPAAAMPAGAPPKPPTDLHALRNRALAAFQAARGRASVPEAGDAWQVLDARYVQLQQVLKASWATSAGANPNSAADKAALAGEERALVEAIEYFESYQPPKAPKSSGMPGQVFAHHAAAGGEHWLEKRDRLEREQVARGEAA